jgi:hypothetical protein
LAAIVKHAEVTRLGPLPLGPKPPIACINERTNLLGTYTSAAVVRGHSFGHRFGANSRGYPKQDGDPNP